MERQALKDEIIFTLTGGLLNCELDEKALDMLINSGLREIQRYVDSTKLITIPYSRCIDMSEYKVNSVSRVYRAVGFTSDTATGSTTYTDAGGNTIKTGITFTTDPMQASQWQLLSGVGNLNNFTSYAYNYASWNTLLQIRNTTSTDLIFRYDKDSNLLYINVSSNLPTTITIEYVPRYDDVSEITSDFWIDMLTRLCIAKAKIAVGRIRTRYSQSNALWAQDGETMLSEGNAELSDLHEKLEASTQLVYPVD